jgi:hypothetical protein
MNGAGCAVPLTTTPNRPPAADHCYLLHKYTERVQSFGLALLAENDEARVATGRRMPRDVRDG